MSDFVLPETRYAASGDINIAYQTMGDGSIDIILVPGIASHVEFLHEFPGYTAFLRRLSSFARVVTFDKRGQGLSDRISDAPSLEQRIDDVRAIMDEVGSKQAVLLGFSEGSPMSALFAATYPDRVSKLILFGGYASNTFTEEAMAQRFKLWGTGAMAGTDSRSPRRSGSRQSDRQVRASIGQPRHLQGLCGAGRQYRREVDFISHTRADPCAASPDRRADPRRTWPRSRGANPRCEIYRISERRSYVLVRRCRRNARRYRGVRHRSS
jgi:pimeloyl-ACP methyl ester carboxylesterase